MSDHQHRRIPGTGRKPRTIALVIASLVTLIAGTEAAAAVTASSAPVLQYSATKTHVGPKALSTGVVTLPTIDVYVAGKTTGYVTAAYYVDDPTAKKPATITIAKAPFDVTIRASRLPAGKQHSILAILSTSTGKHVSISASFTVRAATGTVTTQSSPSSPASTSGAVPTSSSNTSSSSDAGDGARATPAPVAPATPAAAPELCTNDEINNEPKIIAAYSPTPGQSVGAGQAIRVWVNDEHAPFIAPGETLDPTTGRVTKAGDRTAKAPDGYLWEPALYIAPNSAESGGTPHFPSLIKGDTNNDPPNKNRGNLTPGVQVDAVPAGANMDAQFTSEYVWDVNSLKLAAGTYTAEFVIFDGDRDRGVGCTTITLNSSVAKPTTTLPPTTTTTTRPAPVSH